MFAATLKIPGNRVYVTELRLRGHHIGIGGLILRYPLEGFHGLLIGVREPREIAAAD